MKSILTAAFLISLSCVIVPVQAQASVTASGQARLPVKIVAGRLVVRCDLSTRFRRIPANLLLDFANPCGLQLHNRAANPLRVDEGGLPIRLHFPGFNIDLNEREHGDERFLDDFTKLYSRELGEVACVGTIGSELLARYHVTFDVARGIVELEAPRGATGAPPAEEGEGQVTSISVVNGLVWVPVRIENGTVTNMSLVTHHYDSLVDAEICDDMDRPAGDIGSVRLKTTDLSQFVAFRPEEMAQPHPDGSLGAIGLNILEHFRVEIDRVNMYARFTQTSPAEFPVADRAFFQAMVTEEVDELVAFLDAHPDSRCAREAAELVVGLLIDEDASEEKLDSALSWFDRTRIEDLRATEALTAMANFAAAGRNDMAVKAARIGIKSGRKDRYPESVHKLHAGVGEILLEDKRHEEAWEHLLSAAFGLPEDGEINLNLGRLYEEQGRYRRAMSRFIQAVITPEAGQRAVAGLERVQAAIGNERLSVDLVDRLVSGKVDNLSAATKFQVTPETDTNRTTLVELFTNPHLGRKRGEAWISIAVGGAMAIEGVLSHFPRDRVVVLNHQIVPGEPHAMMNPLGADAMDRYGIDQPTLTVIDGRSSGPGAARRRDGSKAYDRNRELVMEALANPSPYDITELTASLEKGVLSGRFVVKGPEREGATVQIILAERGVLYPGKGKIVVHRMVARGVLTDVEAGFDLDMRDGPMVVDFSKSLAAVVAGNLAFLEDFEKQHGTVVGRLSTTFDPDQLSVVVVVRDASNAVMQCAQFDLGAGKKR